jgi:hypothetical protein
MLAEDPLLFNLIYIHKYFHIFIYFISQDMKKISSAYSDDTKSVWEAWAALGHPFLPKKFKSFFLHMCTMQLQHYVLEFNFVLCLISLHPAPLPSVSRY